MVYGCCKRFADDCTSRQPTWWHQAKCLEEIGASALFISYLHCLFWVCHCVWCHFTSFQLPYFAYCFARRRWLCEKKLEHPTYFDRCCCSSRVRISEFSRSAISEIRFRGSVLSLTFAAPLGEMGSPSLGKTPPRRRFAPFSFRSNPIPLPSEEE